MGIARLWLLVAGMLWVLCWSGKNANGQNPTIQVDLISNTTRLPNMAPYNTFFLTCTATVLQGVVSPKIFTWRRRRGASTSDLNVITDNGGSILITSTNLDQPTSTSVLTVRETTARNYRYRCRVDLSESSVVRTMDVYPINVTGPANPVQPQNLMNISTRHDRATVQWSISYIAYTPETYAVNYGLTMNSLGMSATSTQRGDNFTIPSQPFVFSAELTGLSPGVTYYYQVEARNTRRFTLSAVQQFTSTEQPPGSVGCPSRWTDLTSAIQVNWTAPQRPNGIVLRYYLVLTSFSGTSVIASTTVNSNSTLTTDFTARLNDGVPYTVQIFAENSAGNGTVCNVTDFTNELEPPAPSGVTVTRVSDTVIRVMWQRLSLVEARGHIRYRVMVTATTPSKRKRQSTQGERMCTLMSPCEVPANESSVLVGGLNRDTSYSVTVNAINSENEVGSTSAPVIATRMQATGTSVVGIVVGVFVGFVVVIIILVVIMGAVIGVLIARNKRYRLSIQELAGKDQPVKWNAVTKSGDADITTTQCEAYGFADFGLEYEEVPTSEMIPQPPNPEYDITTTQCPAYIPTSQQKERVEEGEYETV